MVKREVRCERRAKKGRERGWCVVKGPGGWGEGVRERTYLAATLSLICFQRLWWVTLTLGVVLETTWDKTCSGVALISPSLSSACFSSSDFCFFLFLSVLAVVLVAAVGIPDWNPYGKIRKTF